MAGTLIHCIFNIQASAYGTPTPMRLFLLGEARKGENTSQRIELERKGECEGGKRERRVAWEGRDDGEREKERECERERE